MRDYVKLDQVAIARKVSINDLVNAELTSALKALVE